MRMKQLIFTMIKSGKIIERTNENHLQRKAKRNGPPLRCRSISYRKHYNGLFKEISKGLYALYYVEAR